MTTYTAIANTEIDADSPITTTLMQSMRDNPIAISEGSTDAPVVASGWHPYDMVTVGDGNDGAIYDSAVDGSVATVATPSFEDGYEYAIVFEALGATSTNTINVRIYLDVAAGYSAWTTVSAAMNLGLVAGRPTGILYLPMSRMLKHVHELRWEVDLANQSTGSVSVAASVVTGARDHAGGLQIRASGSNIAAGKIKLLRRREYFTG